MKIIKLLLIGFDELDRQFFKECKEIDQYIEELDKIATKKWLKWKDIDHVKYSIIDENNNTISRNCCDIEEFKKEYNQIKQKMH